MAPESENNLRVEIGHVLFIDLVGYSKLLIEEQKERVRQLTDIVMATAQVREATNEQLVRLPTGDGMALVFRNSSEEPARCALDIAKALKAHLEIPVRMGVHSGPISGVVDVGGKANLAGAGINLAQRVMDCGDAGHILLSRHVAEDLEQYGHWQPHLHDLGEWEVKHGARLGVVNLYRDDLGNPQLPKKFQVLKKHGARVRWASATAAFLAFVAIVTGIAIFSHYRRGSTLAAPEKSIAVLPFENLSRDPDNAYFTEGVQDEILTRLSKLAGFKVISRTSTQRFKSSPEHLPQIASQLGVMNILEGSVQRAADEVRVNVQLIKASTDAHLWADSYDRKTTDIFGVESEIAQAVAENLQAKLTGSEQQAITARPTENAAAHDLYLRGRFFWNKRTAPDFKTALGYFEQAVKADPNYAVAYAGMADCYTLLPLYGGGVPADLYPKAITMAQKAIAIDSSLAEPHASLGLIHALFDFDFPTSVSEFEQAIQLNPNYATAHQWFGDSTLPSLRQFDRANAELQRALELDPLSVAIYEDVGTTYWITGRYQDAVAQLRKAIEMDPRNYSSYWGLGQALEGVGDLPGAMAAYQKSVELDDDPFPLGLLGAAKAKAGDRAAALAILQKLEETAKHRYVADYLIALVHLALGEKDEAMRWFESSYAKHQPDLNWIRVDPALRSLHGDPRYEALAEKIVPTREMESLGKQSP
jgi:TolB-like protein/Tfp pilus assembly protein PilF/class 3 adenylate cyclase